MLDKAAGAEKLRCKAKAGAVSVGASAAVCSHCKGSAAWLHSSIYEQQQQASLFWSRECKQSSSYT